MASEGGPSALLFAPLDEGQSSRSGERATGFTLVELMVSMTILVFIMAILFGMLSQTSNLWRNTSNKMEGFANARAAFDAMTRTLSQATLNTYYDYMDAGGNWVTAGSGTPSTYGRRSDLHFICGQGSTLLSSAPAQTPVTHCVFFQAPLGYSATYASQQQLLNACGFYLVYGPDPAVPSFLPSLSTRYRYRLMEFLQPSEKLQVYETSSGATQNNWFAPFVTTSYDSSSNLLLAENIVALVIWPKSSAGDQAANGTSGLTTDYSYDTRKSGGLSFNQLPPIVEVTMIAIDETSALRMGNPSAPPNAAIGLVQGGSTLFTSATYPTGGDQSQLESDLAHMEATLTAAHLNFHVFQTEVAIGGAKWASQTIP